MSLREFERWLKKHGARFERHGSKHDIWANGEAKASVPRHGEIRRGTASSICKQLNIPEPR
ncbi:MAG: type II toxin-antitoxin system HicA family toxin [Actinomycetota bacterium]|nr:type II toxin-antitoxin system HicA family toxin [Actinomycetota bacterium]